MSNKFERLSQVKSITGLSRSTIYKWMNEDKFPKSIQLGGRSIAWLESDIQAWIESRVAKSKAVA